MLSEATPIIRTIKIPPDSTPPENNYPHYRLLPVQTETGRFYCLFFLHYEQGFFDTRAENKTASCHWKTGRISKNSNVHGV